MRGSCLCGQISYELMAPVELLVHCHCSRCRKAHGAPYATFAAVPRAGFRWIQGEEAVATYAPDGWGTRPYCPRCGSPAPAVRGDRVDVPAGALEGPLPDVPGLHIFVGSKAPWVELSDGLPQHEEYPPEWL